MPASWIRHQVIAFGSTAAGQGGSGWTAWIVWFRPQVGSPHTSDQALGVAAERQDDRGRESACSACSELWFHVLQWLPLVGGSWKLRTIRIL